MSSTQEEAELKGGHLPAAKVGNMRVKPHRTSNSEKEKISATVSVEEKNVLGLPAGNPKATGAVSGAPVHGHVDFSPQAVQHFHEKPHPVHDARTCCSNVRPNIQQPKKS